MSQPVKVLIVDDKRNMRRTLINLLYEFDCVFEESETGEEALEKISATYFDVVFFDNKLPGEDGIEIIAKIRRDNLPVGKIFFLTGYPEENTKLEAEELKVYCFLNKNEMDFDNMTNLFRQAIA